MPPIRLEALTLAAAGVTGRRYCSSHHGEAASDTGEFVVRGNVRRWMCFACKTRAQNALAAMGNKMRVGSTHC